MTSVSIHIEKTDSKLARFRAVAGTRQSVGLTPGQALDALNEQLGEAERAALIVVQQIGPDLFFGEDQYRRMRELLDRRGTLTDSERSELEELVKNELIASAKRNEALADALGR
jgi:hypothetical protein